MRSKYLTIIAATLATLLMACGAEDVPAGSGLESERDGSLGVGIGSGGPGETIVGNGKRVDEDRKLSGFTRIVNSATLGLLVKQGDTFSVTISIDENLLPLYQTEVVGDTLRIWNEPDVKFSSKLFGPQAVVVMPHLRALDQSGTGAVRVIVDEPEALSFSQSGTGSLQFIGSAPSLDVDFGGTGEHLLEGTTTELTLDLSGTGSIDAEKLRAVRGSVSLGGTGTIRATYTEAVRVDAAGTGKVDLFGGAKLTQEDPSRTGRVEQH
jgi:hypothetical protein